MIAGSSKGKASHMIWLALEAFYFTNRILLIFCIGQSELLTSLNGENLSDLILTGESKRAYQAKAVNKPRL